MADLECFDEYGGVTLSAGTLFGRVLGSVDTGLVDGARYFPGLTSSGADHWYMTSIVSAPAINCLPIITVANDTVSWRFVDFIVGSRPAPRLGCSIIVGTD